MVEHLPFKQVVGSSSLPTLTRFQKVNGLQAGWPFLIRQRPRNWTISPLPLLKRMIDNEADQILFGS